MKPNVGLNYWHFAEHVDVISWDSYPLWHFGEEEWREGMRTGFFHDLHRSYKSAPFMLMESTPSATNWQGISIPKMPNMHLLASLQAVAHGSNTVQYFQWRQSRGGIEKFHSAVVSHRGTSEAKVFQDVAAVGRSLETLTEIAPTNVRARVAVVYDLENEWALDHAQIPNEAKNYQEQCITHYSMFWQMGMSCDVIDSHACSLSGYSLVVAPMLYMVREGVAEKLTRFVEDGGTLVLTYLSGIVDDTDLCFLGGFPGPLKELAGITVEDTDTLHGKNTQAVVMDASAVPTCGAADYLASDYADRIHADGANVIGRYARSYMKDTPAVTVNAHGKGEVFYLASRNEHRFLADFYEHVISRIGTAKSVGFALPTGVTCQTRQDDEKEYLFVMNFNQERVALDVGAHGYRDLLTGDPVKGHVELPSYGIWVLEPVG